MAWIGHGRGSLIVRMVGAPLVPAGLVIPTVLCPGWGMRRVRAFKTGDTAPAVIIAEAGGGQAHDAVVDDRGRAGVRYHTGLLAVTGTEFCGITYIIAYKITESTLELEVSSEVEPRAVFSNVAVHRAVFRLKLFFYGDQ